MTFSWRSRWLQEAEFQPADEVIIVVIHIFIYFVMSKEMRNVPNSPFLALNCAEQKSPPCLDVEILSQNAFNNTTW